MLKFKKYLSENPDRIDREVWWGRQDSRTFGYINNRFFISKDATNHPKYFEHLLNSRQISKIDFPDGPPEYAHRDNFKYPGRLWVNEKIISFWKFPSKSDFNKLVDDLKRNGIDINNEWKVDIKKSDSSGPAELLPISDYTDKFKSIKIKQVDHIMDPIAKNIIKRATGYSTTQTKGIKLPKNMSFAEYRSLIMKSESISTVAPTSISTGQHPKQLGDVEKREEPREIIKKKIKKKLKDKKEKKDA